MVSAGCGIFSGGTDCFGSCEAQAVTDKISPATVSHNSPQASLRTVLRRRDLRNTAFGFIAGVGLLLHELMCCFQVDVGNGARLQLPGHGKAGCSGYGIACQGEIEVHQSAQPSSGENPEWPTTSPPHLTRPRNTGGGQVLSSGLSGTY